MANDDIYNLERFREIQDTHYHRVKAELSMGRKQSHWIWYIFPQILGLGESAIARKYAITSIAEAEAYLADILLGGRLRECCQLLLNAKTNDIEPIMGKLDGMKVRSCMTLFSSVANPEPLFQQILDKFFAGEPDKLSLRILARQADGING